MALRKSVLTRQKNILSDSIANVSTTSAYESAADDSDNSLYFSFTSDTPVKASRSSASAKDESDVQNQSISSMMSNDEEKENTIIMREPPIQEEVVSEGISGKENEMYTDGLNGVEEILKPSNSGVEEETVDSVNATFEKSPEVDKIADHELAEAMRIDKHLEAPLEAFAFAPVDVFPHDPNENIVNPFTSASTSKIELEPEKIEVIPEALIVPKRVLRRTTMSLRTAPISRPYAPPLRKSIEKKSKVISKTTTTRRTLYGCNIAPGVVSGSTASRATSQTTKTTPPAPTKSTVEAKPAPNAMLKPKSLKCSSNGCRMEFTTSKALLDHQKSHKSPSAQVSFDCKWCDKKFKLETAFFNHQTEKCTRIPFNEKKKVLSQRDKKEGERRRTTIFKAPVSAKKSPYRKAGNQSLNKSGILITPKRAIKCHLCPAILKDALSLANHILSHKYSRENLQSS